MGEYYCEYYRTLGSWWITGYNVQPGYYCPDEPPGEDAAPDGASITIDPFKESDGASTDANEYFVDYEYRDGKFQIKRANFPKGHTAPTDPIEFAKKVGTLRIYPARFRDDQASGENTA